MDLEKLNEGIESLSYSPIRMYLKDKENISFFENEKNMLSNIDKIIEINKENMKNPLKIVILGEVKAGKSTIVNSLITKKISYTNVVEATASILEIKYSNKERILIDRFDGDHMELNSLKKLDDLINNNKNNQDFFGKVNKILIETNIERLKEITLVDTPGLNTVTNANEERTEDYIANADVILWILNSNHLGQSDVSEKIEEVLDYGKPIICVLNRIDEINGNQMELVEYVKDEMGYMFTEIFAISGKKAWDGYSENNFLKIEESNINQLYDYILNDIERNSENVQMSSIVKSITMQIQNDLYVHKEARVRINKILEKLNKDLSELKEFNIRIKIIIKNKINEWIDNEFFEEEKQLLNNANEGDEFNRLVKKYTDEQHIQTIINFQYEKFQEYVVEEWKNNTNEFFKREFKNEIVIKEKINPYDIIGTVDDTSNDNDVIEGIKQGGITASAVGVGLAGYAAWLGPAAAYISIGSAVATVLPPLLIVGTIGGAVWNFIGKDKKKINRYNQVDELVFELKSIVKKNILTQMKENLYSTSNYYLDNSSNVVTSIIEQCNITIDELVKFDREINDYWNKINNINLDDVNIDSIFISDLKK